MARGQDEPLAARLRRLFTAELADAVRALTDGLLALESDAGIADRQGRLRELFRVAHGTKGAAHSAAVHEAVAVASRLEDGLAMLRDEDRAPTSEEIARFLADVDDLAAIHAGLEEPRPVDESRRGASPPPPPGTRPSAGRAEALASGAREVATTAQAVDALANELADVAAALDVAMPLRVDLDRLVDRATALGRTLHRVGAELVDDASDLLLRPFADACEGLARVARDLAARNGKRVQLDVVSGDTACDRAVIAVLREPLLHLVRNAVDHGIEKPDIRRAAGKPETGVVRISANVTGGLLRVLVHDDGRGVDVDALRVAAGDIAASEDDGLELAFRPGVTTAASVSDVSGRGIGLDAVRDRVEAVGGAATLDSDPGVGTTVTLTMPVDLTLLAVLTVRTAGDVMCLPASAVRRLVRPMPSDVHVAGSHAMVVIDGASVPIAPLASVLDGSGVGVPGPSAPLVVLEAGGRVGALAVDEVLDTHDVVVRPSPSRLGGLGEVLGVAVLASGAPVLVLNPAACLRRALHVDDATARSVGEPAAAGRRILLVEDTVTTRALEQSILEAAGYLVTTAADGAEAWQHLQRDGTDLIVTDVDMPRMDGFELCRRVRRSERFADIPVVLVTSLGSAADRRAGVDAGANAYVVKADFDQETLLDTVARLL